MKIKFINLYKSIDPFEELELPEFTILTGVNGSGKTHLLEGIINRNVELNIKGEKAKSISHFNYQNFIAKVPKNNAPAQRDRNKRGTPQDIMRLEDLDEIDQELIRSKNAVVTIINSYLAVGTDQTVKEIVISVCLDNIDIFKTLNENEIESFSNKYRIGADSIEKEKIKIVYDKYIKIMNSIKEKLNDNAMVKKYNEFSKKIQIPLSRLQTNHFTFSESNLGEGLILKIKNYRVNQDANDIAETRNRRGVKNSYLSPEEFIKTHGQPPWHLMNEILSEYNCNNYLISEENIEYPPPHQPIENWFLSLYLKNSKNGATVRVDDLSSGEKTLLALALMIYIEKEKKGLPEVLLLDEIDANLHPSMIQQLLKALQKIFIEKRGIKIILATHSPTTIALAPDNSTYIISPKGSVKRIEKKNKADALEILTEGYATLEQGVKFLDQVVRNKINIFTEGHNTEYLKKANGFFGNDEIEIITGLESISGKNSLETYFKFFSNIDHENKIVFVWDCDAKDMRKYNPKNNTFPFVFDFIDEDKKRAGIEALFPKDLLVEDFYEEKDKGGHMGTHQSFNKGKFREHMIKNGTKENFKGLKQLFDYIKNEVDKV